ncbi:hypothetical protein A2803_03220 [Candidatus Woesebacteria bacterium RIFCSPHIGHO2_01_FULL_44_21]|uniref:CYTH domain-containing protein n=1 Tax=Candidatus Woesebacteria bacterium RIFCSPHIGHO2_01_FULL_44_21 TaxID=1802503 RepID=A0A1F7Z176_9BACT|nr:MAG: hypothetical protein A2803_03220 [Candidatus Woesebacteria bacterium RIFCSPHIGHO2_01_FULL_44_21]OGM69155.1 MAG: hypothetical protein A2897_05020 [Candidatus Woesebacteria bacterium RIFCSPLOWO2_01_FULL_44_24b]
MAQNNIEVEIKIQLSKAEFDDIKKKIKKTSKFVKSSHHVDSYYNSGHKNFLKPKYPYEWLSIRARDGKILLNYKHWYPEGVKHTTHCNEYETEVSDKVQLKKILHALEIKEIITVDKKRETYIYKKTIEIAFDEVVGLGYFLEAESLKNSGGVEKTYKKLERFVKSLGVNEIKTIPGGYAAAMMRKKGLMKAS